MDEEMITTPYYETTYIDDYNDKHITRIKDDNTLMFYRERFDVIKCDYIGEGEN